MRSKLIDRFTGEAVVDVPPTLIEGRYVVAAPIWLGAHTRLKQGEPLISDGAARCQLEDVEVTFSIDDLAKANEARAGLCAEAIRSIADRSRSKDLLSTSPLLAINLDKEAEPTIWSACCAALLQTTTFGQSRKHRTSRWSTRKR